MHKIILSYLFVFDSSPKLTYHFPLTIEAIVEKNPTKVGKRISGKSGSIQFTEKKPISTLPITAELTIIELEELLRLTKPQPDSNLATVNPADNPTKYYLKEINQFPLLDASQEVTLAKAIEAGNKAKRATSDEVIFFSPTTQAEYQKLIQQGEAAKRRLTEANLRLVVSIAVKHLIHNMPLLDLIQEGNIGLARAVEKFDYTKGFKFSTHATWWIRQAIARATQEDRIISIPVHLFNKHAKLTRGMDALSERLGYEVNPREYTAWETHPEWAESPAIHKEQIQNWQPTSKKEKERLEKNHSTERIFTPTISLDDPSKEKSTDKSTLADYIEDRRLLPALQIILQKERRKITEQLLHTLSPLECKVLELRFGFIDNIEWKLTEVGTHFNESPETIKKIEIRALRKLRHPSRFKRLKGLLKD